MKKYFIRHLIELASLEIYRISISNRKWNLKRILKVQLSAEVSICRTYEGPTSLLDKVLLESSKSEHKYLLFPLISLLGV